ncbi:MAG TPA: hypothetical protein VIC08_02530 [Cellvibrionaceae bacterium]
MLRIFRSLSGVAIGLLIALSLQAHPLEGSWQLVSGKIITDGVTTDYAEAKMQGIKVIAGNHFSFSSHNSEGFYAAAAGKIIIGGDSYAEIPIYASYPPMIGETYQFRFTVDGDIWEKLRYEQDELVEREIWQRLP